MRQVKLQAAIRSQVASFIMGAREDASHSLESASKLLGYTSPRQLRSYESGQVPIPVGELYRMFVVYGQPIDVFLEFSERLLAILETGRVDA